MAAGRAAEDLRQEFPAGRRIQAGISGGAEGEKAAIGLQANGTPSLVIDDPLQIGECFYEKTRRFTKPELQEIVYQLADGKLRQRLEAALRGDGWEIDGSAVRFALINSAPISGARLVKGHHLRLR